MVNFLEYLFKELKSDFFSINLTVAKWKKIHSRIVTTKERKYGNPVRREGSPVPGVELFDKSADGKLKEINPSV